MTPAEVTQMRLARIQALHQLQPLRWPFATQPPAPPEPEHRTCLGCGARHPINPDGTPEGGGLPCGH
ncbi:hypothetical protein [Acidovorax sp. BL-A-41-H1]|uniref:hypothetical protein n=1 Tax=Acidovorax sp. BL-A-41-H1 TaxID=3421102 RepID=UPI003F79141D